METTPPFTGLGYTCRVAQPGRIILAAVGEAPKQAAGYALALAVEVWMAMPVTVAGQARTNREVWQVDEVGVGWREPEGDSLDTEIDVWCADAMTDRLRGTLAKAGLARVATEAYKVALAEGTPAAARPPELVRQATPIEAALAEAARAWADTEYAAGATLTTYTVTTSAGPVVITLGVR